ncbi:MAG TPA: trypsin-like peptidase domain-containing protein, partial [Solirubrobacteraceae bacterium]|nr:trypsin-like peptidase domain-containing protein [Solirubrobacteraceae bacterium]
MLVAVAAAGCGGSDGDEQRSDGANEPRSAAGAAAGATLAAVPEIYRTLEPSVVAVEVRGAQGSGEGSGVVYKARQIVTNHHVIAGAAEIDVAIASGERLDARLVASDPRTDLALLSVERDLPPATFARSVPPVGSLAVAIGNPLGFSGSVTAGIVSGVDRAIPSGGLTPALVNLLQTDAPISPGNSGGALVDGDGEVIGITEAYLPPVSGAVAIGFAIPAATVVDVVEELREDGRAEHAFLGLQPSTLTPDVAERLDVSVDRGVVVLSVQDGGPAARAGLRPGDVITALAGEEVES